MSIWLMGGESAAVTAGGGGGAVNATQGVDFTLPPSTPISFTASHTDITTAPKGALAVTARVRNNNLNGASTSYNAVWLTLGAFGANGNNRGCGAAFQRTYTPNQRYGGPDLIHIRDNAGAKRGSFTATAVDTGFLCEVNSTTSSVTYAGLGWVFNGGNVAVGEVRSLGNITTTTVTLGFTPDIVLLFGAHQESTSDSYGASWTRENAGMFFGVSHNDGGSYSHYGFGWHHNTGTFGNRATGQFNDTHSMFRFVDAGSASASVRATGFANNFSNGFDYVTTGTAVDALYLAWKAPGKVKSMIIDTPTATGLKTYTASFTVSSIWVMTTPMQNLNSKSNSDCAVIAFGCGGNGDEGVLGMGLIDNDTYLFHGTPRNWAHNNQCIHLRDPTTVTSTMITAHWSAPWTGSPGGFILSFGTVQASAYKCLVIATGA